MNTAIPISVAAAKYGIRPAKLWGHAMRDELDDPLIVDKTPEGEPLVLEDWRLKRLANSLGDRS